MPRGGRRLPDRCVELLRAARLIVHTGDLVGLSVLRELEAFGATLACVHGNMDEAGVRARLPERVVVEHDGLRVGVIHDGGPRAGRHRRLTGLFPTCDLVAYGHSHVPEIARHDERWIVNPGSPTERRRSPAHTMIVVEDREPRLVELSH